MRKSILSILTLVALALSSPSAVRADEPVRGAVVHQDFSFIIGSFTDRGDRVYYEPFAVEQFTRSFLKQLGAKDVTVRVSGIPGHFILNPVVSVRFDAIRLPGRDENRAPVLARWKNIRISGFDNGHLARQVLRNVIGRFEVRDFKGSRNPRGDGPYRFRLKALVAAE